MRKLFFLFFLITVNIVTAQIFKENFDAEKVISGGFIENQDSDEDYTELIVT